MKWSKKYWKVRFAFIPHKCRHCDRYFWLERFTKIIDSYGDASYYCNDCEKIEK